MANYIKFRHNEALLVKLKIKRLSAAFFLLHKVPEQVIEESQRDPAAFLFAIRRLFLNRNRQELQFSLLRINQKARKTAHLGYLQTEVMLKMTLSTKTILSLGKVIARNQQYQLKSSLDEIALHSARKLHDTKMFCQRIYLGLRTLTSTLANLKQKTNRQTFSACFRTIQEHQKTSLSSTVKSLTQQLEAAREETRSSESMVLALKAEFSKIRAEQTSTMLDYQKAMAKVKVLEGENLSLVTRINADVEGREKESKVLQASIEKANRDLEKSVREKEKAVTEVQKARAECETLKSQLKEALTLAEERIGESQNQADFRLLKVLSEKQELENIVEKLTVESARAAAGRAELADKLAEVFRQREQEKNWISQKEQDNKALSATVLTLEAQLKEALKQNNLYKEKLADTTNDLTLIKSELQKRSKETSDTINSLSKEKSTVESELALVRSTYEDKLKALNQSHASTLAQSTLVLSSEVDELRSQVEHLENELLSAQNQAATSKNKRESVIRELKIQNGQLTEQFMQANSALNKFREEAERLREELKRKETIFTSSEKNEKLERSRREELDKEVRDLRDKVGKMQAAEEEYLDLKNNKLPEKETIIAKMSNTVAELNREKVNMFRDVRILYEKYVKLQEECNKSIASAKEAQEQNENLQTQMETYKKLASSQARKIKQLEGKSSSQSTSDLLPMQDLIKAESFQQIREKYNVTLHKNGSDGLN